MISVGSMLVLALASDHSAENCWCNASCVISVGYHMGQPGSRHHAAASNAPQVISGLWVDVASTRSSALHGLSCVVGKTKHSFSAELVLNAAAALLLMHVWYSVACSMLQHCGCR